MVESTTPRPKTQNCLLVNRRSGPATLRYTRVTAEALGMKRFAGNAERDELVNDAVSVAWEMAMNARNRRNGHPGTVATFAVRLSSV